MALETPCQTPGALFHTRIEDRSVEVKVDLPGALELSEDEAAILEANVHNAMELVLARYWERVGKSSR